MARKCIEWSEGKSTGMNVQVICNHRVVPMGLHAGTQKTNHAAQSAFAVCLEGAINLDLFVVRFVGSLHGWRA
jgi:hypothetical protein